MNTRILDRGDGVLDASEADVAQITIWTDTQRAFSPEISVTGEIAVYTIPETTPQEGASIPIPIVEELAVLSAEVTAAD
ncbi:MAG: hypothetical protein ABSG53_00730 [Thermoguttaceae bacterium]